MLSNAYFLAKIRFDTAENEPAKNLQNFRKMHFRKMHFRKMLRFCCVCWQWSKLEACGDLVEEATVAVEQNLGGAAFGLAIVVIIAQLAALALGAGALRLSLRPDAPIHPAAAVFATVRAFRQQETRVRGTGSRAPRSATFEKSLLFKE